MLIINNKALKVGNKWLNPIASPAPPPPPPDPYNPLGLPANTVRVRTNDGNAPTKGRYTSYETATLVQGTSDVYDVYKSGTSFDSLLLSTSSTNVIEVLGANTTGITDMSSMFMSCSRLNSVPLFDTSSVTNMRDMFYRCNALTSVPLYDTSNVTNMSGTFLGCWFTSMPLFNTSKVTDMSQMCQGCHITTIPLFDTSKVTNINSAFKFCYYVESGALALYNQVSSQANPPTSHANCFTRCGMNTTTGSAELAQIPSGWK